MRDSSTRKHFRLPLRWLLTGAIGGLVLASLVASLWLGLGVAAKNTRALLGQTTGLILTMVVQRTEQYLYPAEAMTIEIDRRIENGEIDLTDDTSLTRALGFSLAAAPQLNAAVYADFDGWLVSVYRSDNGEIEHNRADWIGNRSIRAHMEQMDRNPEPGWGEPVYSDTARTTLLNFASPVFVDDRLVGIVAATIGVETLAEFVSQIDPAINGTGFILLGQDKVLAHRYLLDDGAERSREHPIPNLSDINDPVLEHIWQKGWQDRELELARTGHWGRIDDRQAYFIYEKLEQNREEPWLIGAYFLDKDVDQEMHRLKGATIFSLVVLLLAIAGAFWLARKLARPATRFAMVSERIRNLELDGIEPLPHSRIREVDDAAGAFNAMIVALGYFARYSPRALVQRIISTDQQMIGRNESRQMSVMFTDLAGFTTVAEDMDAGEAAAYLNEHFAMLTEVIEAHGGTVDKFMGDGVLAFWGAPERQSDHADRALAAAVAIARAHVAQDCRHGPKLGLRIGLHSGEVMVGDLGAPSRMNYTVVGDPVNTAHRLQAMGKDVYPNAEVVILVSDASLGRAEHPPPVEPIGTHHLRGRAGTIQVFAVRTENA